jgi:hypothetical protein
MRIPPAYSALFCLVKRNEGTCNGASEALGAWLADNPTETPQAARFAALCAGRVPFPSISGSPPVDRDKPYYDARFKGEA